MSGAGIPAAAKKAGRRGQGGAGFPVGAKMRAVVAASPRGGSWRATASLTGELW